MNQQLQDLIREARLELRRTSGIPLSAEEHRAAEIERMEMFISKALGVRIMFSLLAGVKWTEKGATTQLTLEDRRFQLYKDGQIYRLTDVNGDGERELLNLSGSDPNFGSRVLVAISDALMKS